MFKIWGLWHLYLEANKERCKNVGPSVRSCGDRVLGRLWGRGIGHPVSSGFWWLRFKDSPK